MNTDDKDTALTAMTRTLRDNVGNRITSALANGMLQAVEQELAQRMFIEASKKQGLDLGEIDAKVVSGVSSEQA